MECLRHPVVVLAVVHIMAEIWGRCILTRTDLQKPFPLFTRVWYIGTCQGL